MPLVRLRYQAYGETVDRPNVIVDGVGNAGTVLALSHWPGSPPLPVELQDDLSAQMAFRYLDFDEHLHGDAAVVSNNHFDQDGLVSIFALVEPEAALARRQLLEDLAAAGDFATYRSRDAARASMAISAFTDAERSPFGPLPDDYDELTALLYTEVLGRVPELVDHPDRYRDLWADEDAALSESEAAIADGSVAIVEHPDVDLAVVTVPDGHRWAGHRFGGREFRGLHPMALHNATDATAILLHADGSHRFTYRYETWVQYRSRPIRRRVDLAPLAAELGAADDVPWVASPIEGLTPELAPLDGAPSALDPAAVADAVLHHLRTAPFAFDPFVSS